MRPIAISLSPNTEKDDLLLALKTLFNPRKWFDKDSVENFEKGFEKLFGGKYRAVAVNSGRSALYLILKMLGIGSGDKVALQALTCVAVPNSILWTGARPQFIDVDDTFNLDPNDLEKKISKKVKCVIVQHAFGIPGKIDKISSIAKKHGIPIIEDCALSLGAEVNGRKVGTLSDIAFFSFGRDKVISSVFGGIILTSNLKYYDTLIKLRDGLPNPSAIWVFKQLMHPLVFSIVLPLYYVGLGKIGIGKLILILSQKIGIIDRAVYQEEKAGKKPSVFPAKFPGALALLANNQLYKLSRFNNTRKRYYNLYSSLLNKRLLRFPKMNRGSIWLRVPVLSKYSKEILGFVKSRKIILGDWYQKPIVPTINLIDIGYEIGNCPNSEKYASEIFNLPTYPTMSEVDVKTVADTINLWESLHTKK